MGRESMNNKEMQEPEVSLRTAIYFIRNGLTNTNVKVSIDGAHIRTNNNIHFDIFNFLNKIGCRKYDCNSERWQGLYEVIGYEPKIEITSTPGIGDVVIELTDNKILRIESKKIKAGKCNTEYAIMREAIGQLMTGYEFSDDTIPIVAVPYTPKSLELATRWSQFSQIKKIGIRFIIVYETDNIKLI